MSVKIMSLVWENFKRGGSEKLTMLALADWCNDSGGSLYPSISAVAKKINTSDSQARRIIHSLIDEGYLSVVANHNGGAKRQTRHYKLNVEKLLTPSVDATPCANATPSMDARLPLAPMRVTPSTHASQSIKEPLIEPSIYKTEQSKLCPYEEIIKIYHEEMPDNPRVKLLTSARKSSIKARWNESKSLNTMPFGFQTTEQGLDAWRKFFVICNESKFLTGKVEPRNGYKRFYADIDWIMKPANFAKILENHYHAD